MSGVVRMDDGYVSRITFNNWTTLLHRHEHVGTYVIEGFGLRIPCIAPIYLSEDWNGNNPYNQHQLVERMER